MSNFKNLGMSTKERIIDDLTKLIDAIKHDKIELSDNIMDLSAPFAYDLNIVPGKDECIYGIIYKNKFKKEKFNENKIYDKSITDEEKRAINNNNILEINKSKNSKKKEIIQCSPMFDDKESESKVKSRGRPRKIG